MALEIAIPAVVSQRSLLFKRSAGTQMSHSRGDVMVNSAFQALGWDSIFKLLLRFHNEFCVSNRTLGPQI